ncbi:MAG TPA: SDR family oxidoreductase [Sphingobium sp.]
MNLANKTVVMTGAGNGIGREIALEFGRRGGRVIVSDRDGDAAASVADAIGAEGGEAAALSCDVTKDEDIARLKQAAERYGPVDVLMNHVGAASSGIAVEIPLEDWRWVYDVNVLSVVRALKQFLPDMMARGSGLIINTSSSLGLFPEMPVALPYIACKAGIIAMSEALALQCQHAGVRVMTLAPDITDTGFVMSQRTTGMTIEDMAGSVPMTMMQPPKAVSDALFLAIDEGRFLATNVANFEELLQDRATARLEPRLRAYHQLGPAIAASAEALASLAIL